MVQVPNLTKLPLIDSGGLHSCDCEKKIDVKEYVVDGRKEGVSKMGSLERASGDHFMTPIGVST